MSLSEILNLSQPRLVAAVVVGSVAVVGISLEALRYSPKVWDSCEGATSAGADDQFANAAELYLRQSRNWSQGDYCITQQLDKDREHIVIVFRRGQLVGGGEGFEIRIDPTRMTVIGERSHE